jgi:hypothetical protein
MMILLIIGFLVSFISDGHIFSLKWRSGGLFQKKDVVED